MDDLVVKAKEFALVAHDGHVRKYTNEPYLNHLIEVQKTLDEVGARPEVQAAGLLHDVIEDTKVEISDLKKTFDSEVVAMVEGMTEITTLDDGNRKKRKKIERERFSTASSEVKTIKLADVISNSRTIFQYDKKFGKVFLSEIELLLPLLKGGNDELYLRLQEIIRTEGIE